MTILTPPKPDQRDPLEALIKEARARQRRRRRIAALILGAVLLATALTVAVTRGPSKRGHRIPQRSSSAVGHGCPTRTPTARSHTPGERLQIYWPHSDVLHGLGLTVDIPAGWCGQVYRRLAPVASAGAIVHLANFRLGPPDGYDPEGGVVRHGEIVPANSVMSSIGVVVTITEHGLGEKTKAAPLSRPLQLTSSDRTNMEGVCCGRAAYGRSFTAAGRSFDIVAQYGTAEPPSGLFEKVNQMLATLRVARTG
jgi:hypothetical protein